MKTESPDTSYPPQASEGDGSSEGPSTKVQKVISFNESLGYTCEEKFFKS